ncbi:hypothetical protein L9F63_019903, partial [Diploptera punctata]
IIKHYKGLHNDCLTLQVTRAKPDKDMSSLHSPTCRRALRNYCNYKASNMLDIPVTPRI